MKELLESPTNTLTASFDELFSTELPGKSPDEDGNIGEFLVRVQGDPDEQPDRGWSLRIRASVLLNVISSMFNSRRKYMDIPSTWTRVMQRLTARYDVPDWHRLVENDSDDLVKATGNLLLSYLSSPQGALTLSR